MWFCAFLQEHFSKVTSPLTKCGQVNRVSSTIIWAFRNHSSLRYQFRHGAEFPYHLQDADRSQRFFFLPRLWLMKSSLCIPVFLSDLKFFISRDFIIWMICHWSWTIIIFWKKQFRDNGVMFEYTQSRHRPDYFQFYDNAVSKFMW